MKKRQLAVSVAGILLAVSLAGCSGSGTAETSMPQAEALMEAYNALEWTPTGRVAVKMSTGEPPASNYLRPELVGDLIRSVDGTIVECNTAYGGSRAETAMHYQVAENHGFTAIADFQIQDEEGSMSIPVEGGTRLTENFVGAAFGDYDSYLVLSHFKAMPWRALAGRSKTFPSDWAPARERAGFILEEPARPGLPGNRMRSWKPWGMRERQFRITLTMGNGLRILM